MKNTTLTLALFTFFLACAPVKKDTADNIEEQIDSIISLMTIEEKIGQMTQIDQLDCGGVKVLQQDVLRLDIAMHDVHVAQQLQRLRSSRGVSGDEGRWEHGWVEEPCFPP